VSQKPKLFKTTIRVPVQTKYLLHLPDGYRGSKARWPLMLFLHGAGECGSNLAAVAVHGPPKLVASGKHKFPFVIVSPQCPCGEWWNNRLQIEALGKLLDDVEARYRIDRKRIYVTGLSMGGFGTWSLAAKFPRRFAAIVPICGGGNPAEAAKIAHLPTWVFHGAKDGAVPLQKSQEMVQALRKAGGKPRLTVYPDAGHDSWSAAYDNPALYQWLLRQKR
jgi:predicted peptidase